VYSRFSINLRRAMYSLNAICMLLSNIGDILLYVTFVQLASGFRLCLRDKSLPSSSRKAGLIAILAWSFVLLAITIASFGLSMHYNELTIEETYSARFTLDEQRYRENLVRSANRLRGAD